MSDGLYTLVASFRYCIQWWLAYRNSLVWNGQRNLDQVRGAESVLLTRNCVLGLQINGNCRDGHRRMRRGIVVAVTSICFAFTSCVGSPGTRGSRQVFQSLLGLP